MRNNKKNSYTKGLTALVLMYLSVNTAAFAQTEISEVTTKTMRFGDWQVRCESRDAAAETCVMNLSIVAKETGTEIVQANFAKQKTGTLMTLVLPHGIYLPAGVMLEIKEHKKYAYPITFCSKEGCFVNEIISDEAVNLLRKKEQAALTLAPTNNQTVELPLSLNGFLDAYKKL